MNESAADLTNPCEDMGCTTSMASTAAASTAEELVKLATLHEEGRVTDAEFAAAKQRVLGTSLPAASAPLVLCADMPGLVGKYECHLYDGGGKNDWHYVTISQEAPGRFRWRNRAGASWGLTWDSLSEWDSYETGDIGCGPGSYYLDDPTITERHENVTTLEQALACVEAACRESPGNPVVLWQLTPQHLLFHRQKFLEQNLDADSGKPIDSGFARSASDFAQGRRYGSPMFFRKRSGGGGGSGDGGGGSGGSCIVGADCTYHASGHTRMEVVTDGAARILAVLGPHGERYDREGVKGVWRCEEVKGEAGVVEREGQVIVVAGVVVVKGVEKG
mmetsp:Transcript_25554/g.52403  ORF Transcript_25554/g.52403 Transcript_25554/m.52403 type:complete len:333 (+) Transcript_25554:163-1161(+)